MLSFFNVYYFIEKHFEGIKVTLNVEKQIYLIYIKVILLINFRFGMGIIIYWFGYVNTIINFPENNGVVIVADTFPHKNDLQLLQFEDSNETEDCSSSK